MSEKKIIVTGKKLAYNGPFNLKELYEIIEDWITQTGKYREIKMKREHVHEEGKNIEYALEIYDSLNEKAKSIVKVRILIQNLKKAKIKKGKTSRSVDFANLLIILDGFLESHHHSSWENNPWYYTMRTFIDYFLFKHYDRKDDDLVEHRVNELYAVLKDYFNTCKLQE
ncbi:MAG: hypothetical protein O2779_04980 [Nanoarchaeota archaeon]|nr:hypothetical protein [Nanoarchaeota archaeon]